MDEQIKALRKEYKSGTLDQGIVDSSPYLQFQAWFEAAKLSESSEANACALATVGVDLKPSVRMVLLKGLDERGFVFFTNYESKKGVQLAQNSQAALLFYWPSLERQVRIEGTVERINEQDSDAYFQTRPRNAQLSAAVSQQSRVADSRAQIEGAYTDLERATAGAILERPTQWGGYRTLPATFEFWQGREGRLHDRILYSLSAGIWRIDRLWP